MSTCVYLSVQFLLRVEGWVQACSEGPLPSATAELEAAVKKHQELNEEISANYTQVPVCPHTCLSLQILVCWSDYLSTWLSVHVCTRLSSHLSLSKHLSVHSPVCLHTHLSICPHTDSLDPCLSDYLSVCRSVRVVKPYWMSFSVARRQNPMTRRPNQTSLLPRTASWEFFTRSCRYVLLQLVSHLS